MLRESTWFVMKLWKREGPPENRVARSSSCVRISLYRESLARGMALYITGFPSWSLVANCLQPG